MEVSYKNICRSALVALAITIGVGLIHGTPAAAKDLDMNKIFRCTATDKPGIDTCNKARTLVLNNCTSCHAFVPIVLQQFDPAGWQGLFDRHRDRVPELKPDELAMVQSYLAANFNSKLPPPELPPELLKQWTSY